MTATVPDRDSVLVEYDGDIVWIRFNRPKALNALTEAMQARIGEVVAEVNGRTDIRVAVLTANGKGFCAGRDLSELDGVVHARSDVPPRFGHPTNSISELDIPVIAAVHGAAVGGGMGMAIMCDIVLATEDAYFADGHLAAQLCPSSNSWWLPRQTSYGNAMDIFLTGRKVGAGEARELGFVQRVVANDALEAEARTLATSIARIDRATLTRTKRVVRGGMELTFRQSIEQVEYVRGLPAATAG